MPCSRPDSTTPSPDTFTPVVDIAPENQLFIYYIYYNNKLNVVFLFFHLFTQQTPSKTRDVSEESLIVRTQNPPSIQL
jgi:hypothetical protein